ncbi:MAG: HPr family phosphocarrier protein, partial [Clostridia bacterium]|nr:HPr family phosphocarrier protein [Clostridia bacterium]
MTTFNVLINSIDDVKNFVNIVNRYSFDIDLVS